MADISGSIPIISCEQVYLLPNPQQCQFVQAQCADHPGFLNSFTLYYCMSQSDSVRSWVGIPLVVLLLMVLFASIGLVAGNCLVPNLNAVASHLNIPENVSGLTLLAFANGSPDIISTYTSFVTGNTSLAFGEIIGAAYFTNSVVIGTIFIVNPFDLVPGDTGGASTFISLQENDHSNSNAHSERNSNKNESAEQRLISLNAKGTYLRDVSFFTVSALILLYCVLDGVLSRIEMLTLVSIYITYVLFIILWQWYYKRELDKIRLDAHARSLYNPNRLPFPFDENIEMQDSYNYNPQIIRNLEFETILSGLTSQRRIGFYIDRPGVMYRDSSDSNENNNNNNNSTNPELGQLQAEIIEPPNRSIPEKIFDWTAFPFVKLFRHTIPIMTTSDYEGDYKPALSQLFELLTSLLTSPFIIVCTLFPNTPGLTKFFMLFPTAALTYFAYHNLVRSSNPSTPLKCVISLVGVTASIAWISIIASEIISLLTLISSLTHIRPSALGITIFALGNSVGDLISCIVITRMGYPLMALAACIGGPLLNMLLGLGMNGLLVGKDYIEIPASASIIFCLLGLLLNLIVVLLIFIPVGGWRCDRYVGSCMIFLWMVGVSVAILMEVLLTY